MNVKGIFTPLLEANIFLPLNTLQKVGWVGERGIASLQIEDCEFISK